MKGKVLLYISFRFTDQIACVREKERVRKAKWRKMKQQQDPDYTEKVKEYDRQRKKQVTSRSLAHEPSTPVKEKPPPSYYRVLCTSKRVQGILGPSPNMHTSVLKHVLKKALKSLRKSTHMVEYHSGNCKDYIMPPKDPSVVKDLWKIAILRSKKKYQEAKTAAQCLRNRFKSVTEIVNKSGESRQAVYRLLSQTDNRRVKTQYERKLNEEDREEVVKIYNDDEVSYSLPDMKYAGHRFMFFTLHEAYGIYLKKCNRKRKVAEKTFEVLKPKYVRTVNETPLRGARCKYCANFGKTREALIALGIKGIPRNHAKAIETTWCDFRSTECDVTNLCHAEMPMKKCVLHNCDQCG